MDGNQGCPKAFDVSLPRRIQIKSVKRLMEHKEKSIYDLV
jgi:hypothetical protein